MLISLGNWYHSKKWIPKEAALYRILSKQYCSYSKLSVALSQLYITSCRARYQYLLCFRSSLKTINCVFLPQRVSFSRNTFKEKIRTQSTLAGRASIHTQPGWRLGAGDIRRGCLSILPAQRGTPGRRPGSSAAPAQLAPLQAADTWAGQSWAVGLVTRDNAWLTHWAHPGVCKAFLGSSLELRSQEVCGWKGRERSCVIQAEALGAGLPQKQSPISHPGLGT